jgi:hypothetical protein
MDIYYIIIGVTFIASLFYYILNELEDECKKNTWKKNKKYLNSNLSWKNKWKLKDGELIRYTKRKWYHFGTYPKYEEKFPFSSTMFVFVTDGEHLFQFLKNIMLLGVFLFIDLYIGIAFFIGKSLGGFIKEKFLQKWMR